MKRLLYFCFPLILMSGNVFAQEDEWVNINEQVTGEELFTVCLICHGSQGQGMDRREGPAIAGLGAWYIEKQLINYRDGIRGYHEEDIPGKFMSGTHKLLRNDETIRDVAEYVASIEVGAEPDANANGPRGHIWDSPYAGLDASITGDAKAGEQAYATCTGCHQADGTGNQAIGAPNLTNLSKIYMERQLMYFRDGLRGAHPDDTSGKLMAGMAKTLTTDQAIADVVAYILELED